MLPRRPIAGRAKIEELPLGQNKRALCRWCGLEVPSNRRSFCCSECVHEYRLRTQPRYVRECVYKRDKAICAICGIDTKEISKQILETKDSSDIKNLMQLYNISTKRKVWKKKYGGGLWDADHIIPVCQGGGQCGLDNYRTLCISCHKEETKKLLSN
jgi:5-methylcytosine-specific restriction endonuclease McrA